MSRDDVYRLLAKTYGYTPKQISHMTREQQYMLLSDSDDGTMKFETFAEYQEWKRSNGF